MLPPPSVPCWWTGAGNSVPATSSPECLRGLYAPDSVKLEEGFTRDMRGIGHLGTGDLEVRVVSAADLEKAAPLIRRRSRRPEVTGGAAGASVGRCSSRPSGVCGPPTLASLRFHAHASGPASSNSSFVSSARSRSSATSA
ncbi:hypothetical protein D3105_00415 [Streptomyces globisporus]|uniref:Uncharacterized protein n=1 Tax=Streptomyces globisporus TaxID=1908 RepID=A0A423V7F9_STRGL|nr:hypothetical protein D3105_00415 [Streptomyces globisporus]